MLVVSSVLDALKKWRIGGLTFSSSVSSKDLREFAHLFVSLDPTTKSIEDFREELKNLAVAGIELKDPRFLNLKEHLAENVDSRVRHKARSKAAYGKAADAVGNVVQSSRDGKALNFKQAKRAIQNIVDLMMQDEPIMLGLTTLRCHDQYTHNHSVNVSLLSIALANRAGYPKVELADLGLAALFHDMGKSTIPLEVLNKPGEFTEGEWTMMRNHPTEGVLSLAQLRGITNLPARMAAASFEHHMNLDYSGLSQIGNTVETFFDGAHSHDRRSLRCHDVFPRLPPRADVALESAEYDADEIREEVSTRPCSNSSSIAWESFRSEAWWSSTPMNSPSCSNLPPIRPRANVRSSKSLPMRRVTPVDNGPELDLTEKDDIGAYRHSIVRLIDNMEYKFDTSRYFL